MQKLVLSLILIISHFNMSAYELLVTGTITEASTGNPIPNKTVEIIIDSLQQGSGYYNIVNTDSNGIYYDNIFVPDSTNGYLLTITDSCNLLIMSENWFSPDFTYIENNYEVCGDSLPVSCDANFFYYPGEEDKSVYFFNLSTGNYDSIHWAFGDGDFSFENDPFHIYPEYGQYITKLTILGDNCYSFIEIPVMVLPDTVIQCEAYFTYYQLEESNTIQFTDESFGDVIAWNYYFGDGQYSSLQNPTHTYDDPGYYMVEFSIQTIDSCISYYTELVYVSEDSSYCNADFKVELDTINNTPNTYLFEDNSIGDSLTWYWDFGDGTYSYLQNPVHIYDDYGTYTVCLTINSYGSGVVCSSSICDTITTMEYFDFGGQVFLGDYPINIDSSDNDNNAIIYLYRKINDSWELMDSRSFWKYGYYWFAKKPKGDYLLHCELEENSLDYNDYSPSYYPNAVKWSEAAIYKLNDEEEFAVNLHLNKLATYKSGTGLISGNILKGISCDSIDNISINDVLIQLYNTNNQVIDYTYSNEQGYFSFNNLGTDSYKLQAEYPGRYSEQVTVELNEISQTIQTDLTVNCSHVLNISENIESNSFNIYEIFPIPASDVVKMKVKTSNESKLNIVISSLSGVVYAKYSYDIDSYSDIINLNISDLYPGYYIIKITEGNTGFSEIRKLIVTK